jgi:putative transcriptional regulator
MRQADLAFAGGKDPQSIERIERGKINPSIYYLKELADGMEIELSELLKFDQKK